MFDVTDASKKVVNTTEWASVALIAVAGVSLVAIIIALTALKRTGNDW